MSKEAFRYLENDRNKNQLKKGIIHATAATIVAGGMVWGLAGNKDMLGGVCTNPILAPLFVIHEVVAARKNFSKAFSNGDSWWTGTCPPFAGHHNR